MFKAYMYIVYRVYDFLLKVGNEVPLFSTSALMLFFHWVQLLTVLNVLHSFYKFGTPPIEKNIVTYLIVGILILGYHLFVIKPNWKIFFSQFEKESMEERKKKTNGVLLFTVGSIVLFFLSMALLRPAV